jgi:SagB-type dehydrogenase family enzyme
MKNYRLTTCSAILVAFVLMLASEAFAAGKVVALPKPRTEGGKPLMEALKARKSDRRFSDKKLPRQTLSNLLWAAFGMNRDNGKRTAPSAVNWQEIDIYVALEGGVFLYDAKAHALKPILSVDIRANVGTQPFTKDAPVGLIYVADYSKMKFRGKDMPQKEKLFYSATDTGYISQNVYLFCASEGLNTVVLGLVDKSALKKKLGLAAHQHVVLSQPVGYPK